MNSFLVSTSGALVELFGSQDQRAPQLAIVHGVGKLAAVAGLSSQLGLKLIHDPEATAWRK